MAPNKRKSFLIDEQTEPKRQRKIKKNMKLSDLNEDVLVQIFLYLNENELLDVVHATKMFLNCCRRVVEKKYKKNTVILPLGNAGFSSKNCSEIDFNRSMDFVRYLGENISKMAIHYGKLTDGKSKRFHDLVLKFCHATLIDIEFYDLSIDLKINKCFPKVKYLGIFNGNVDDSLCQFTNWFPKVEKLFIGCVCNIATKFNTRREISTLKDFSFTDALKRDSVLELCKLNQFIVNNPQLEVLHLNIDSNILRNFNRSVSPRKLVLNSVSPGQMRNVQLKLLDTDAILHLTIPKDRIEHLEVNNCTSNEVTEFVANCFNLKTLKLKDLLLNWNVLETVLVEIFKGATWKRIAKHDLLTHLEIHFKIVAASDALTVGLLAILPFLEQCSELRSVKVGYFFLNERYWIPNAQNANKFDAIKSQIDLKQWSFTSEILLDKNEFSFTLKKL